MTSRRSFLQRTVLAGAAIGTIPHFLKAGTAGERKISTSAGQKPLIIATWNKPNSTADGWKVLEKGGNALDAVEAGARTAEADPEDMTVGYGGRPDRDGNVTLDACIMDHNGNAGSVTFLQHIKHPISVARKVMEKTPHVMLSGAGALRFALAEGFRKENLLTEKAKKAWEDWRKEAKYEPVINIENHDTIGLLALGGDGHLAGACTTSGLAYKMHGRVGDSPIIGAGMFVDDEVGAACATGVGEFVMKTLGSFLVVELMRQGRTPQQACEEAIMRIVKRYPDYKNVQVGYLAVDKAGNTGAYAIQKGFGYVLATPAGNQYHEATSYLG